MDFALGEDHVMLRDSIRDFSFKEVAPGAESRDREAEIPQALREEHRRIAGEVTVLLLARDFDHEIRQGVSVACRIQQPSESEFDLFSQLLPHIVSVGA